MSAEEYVPVVGDRVRVVIEDVVTYVDDRTFHMESTCYDFDGGGVVSVEKLAPPIEVFCVGDMVRNKVDHRFVYSIGEGGYFSHRMSRWFARNESFSSEYFERVNLG